MVAPCRVRGLLARLSLATAVACVLVALIVPAAFAVGASGGVSILAGDGEGAISGRVTNPGGAGLAGITMEVEKWVPEEAGWSWYGWEFRTGADGYYTIAGLDAGVWKVQFSDPACTWRPAEVANITVTDPGTKGGVNVSMQPAGSISGTVKDASAKPVAGAYVQAFDKAEYPGNYMSARTDALGRYTIRGTDGYSSLASSLVIAASHPDFRSRFLPSAQTKDQATTVAFAPGQTLTGKDITLAADTAAKLPAPAKMNASGGRKVMTKYMPRVSGDHVAWLDDGIGITTISTGAKSRITTSANYMDINDAYVFADERIYNASTGSLARTVTLNGYLEAVACDNQYVAYVTSVDTNTLWTSEKYLTVVRLSDWGTKTYKLGDVDVRLSPGGVDGGRVVVNTWDAALVYTWATNTVQQVDGVGYYETVFAGGKLAWASETSIYARDVAATDATLLYSSPYFVGDLATNGNGIVFSEWSYDDMEGTYANVSIKYLDASTKAVKTIWSDPSTISELNGADSYSYDVAGNSVVRLEAWDPVTWGATRVTRTALDTMQSTRVDADRPVPADLMRPALGGGRMAWFDDRTGDYGLYLKENITSAESLVTTDAVGHWDTPLLTPKHLVYTTMRLTDDAETLDIISYDIATKAKRTIATGVDWNTLLMQVEGDKLYYSVSDAAEVRRLKQVDLATGTSVELANVSDIWRLYFKVGGGKLVYQDQTGVQRIVDTATRASSVLSHALPLDGNDEVYDMWAFEYPKALLLSPSGGDDESGRWGTLVCYDFSKNATTTLEGFGWFDGGRPFALTGNIAVAGDRVYDLVGGGRSRFAVPAGLRIGETVARDGAALFTTWSETGPANPAGVYYQTLPKPAAPTPPKVNKAAFANAIAYELKSFLTTQFVVNTDKAGVTAKLTIKTATGDVQLFNGTLANAAGVDYKLPAWNGLVAGKRLPSAAYDWTLTLTKDGVSTTRTGKVTISKILFTCAGTSAAGAAKTHTGYMVPGNANCYVSARTTAGSDTLTVKLTGPYGFSLPSRYWGFTAAAPLSTTSYFKDASAIKYRAVHTFTITGKTNATYSMTVIQ